MHDFHSIQYLKILDVKSVVTKNWHNGFYDLTVVKMYLPTLFDILSDFALFLAPGLTFSDLKSFFPYNISSCFVWFDRKFAVFVVPANIFFQKFLDLE